MTITLEQLHELTSTWDAYILSEEQRDEIANGEGLEAILVQGDSDSTEEDVKYANELWQRLIKTMRDFDVEFHERFDCR